METTEAKLFVANLPFSICEDDLYALFADYGQVLSCRIPINFGGPHSGQSKGFGFVVFSSEREALAAIEALDGFILQGREIAVQVSDGVGADKRRLNGR